MKRIQQCIRLTLSFSCRKNRLDAVLANALGRREKADIVKREAEDCYRV